jgi:hypothetical protein
MFLVSFISIKEDYTTNVAFLTNYATILPFFSSKTDISGHIPTLPG